jgi:enoyl-CoA hydratase/carnithine racemase
MTDSPADGVVTEVTGAVATITLNRPSVRNAFTPAMVDELRSSIESLERHDEVEGLVITGAAGAFCSGADIRWEASATPDEFRRFVGTIQSLTRQLHSSDLFIVAAIEGPALGGGAELALACDYRIASPGALLGFPEAKLGLHVTGGVTHLLPRLVGPSRALELLISGRTVAADEALSIGLIDRLADHALPAALQVAAVRNNAPPGMAALVKAALHAGAESPLDSALRLERETITEAFMRPHAREGMTAFLEKRPPAYETPTTNAGGQPRAETGTDE